MTPDDDPDDVAVAIDDHARAEMRGRSAGSRRRNDSREGLRSGSPQLDRGFFWWLRPASIR
jgi:hypothetical protein